MANTWWVGQYQEDPDEWQLFHQREVPDTEDTVGPLYGPYAEKREAIMAARRERARYIHKEQEA